MSSRTKNAEDGLFADFGKLFYDWHQKDPAGLIFEEEAHGCDMELDRLIELIGYVKKKREAARY
jgi:hypothetical protein